MTFIASKLLLYTCYIYMVSIYISLYRKKKNYFIFFYKGCNKMMLNKAGDITNNAS